MGQSQSSTHNAPAYLRSSSKTKFKLRSKSKSKSKLLKQQQKLEEKQNVVVSKVADHNKMAELEDTSASEDFPVVLDHEDAQLQDQTNLPTRRSHSTSTSGSFMDVSWGDMDASIQIHAHSQSQSQPRRSFSMRDESGTSWSEMDASFLIHSSPTATRRITYDFTRRRSSRSETDTDAFSMLKQLPCQETLQELDERSN